MEEVLNTLAIEWVALRETANDIRQLQLTDATGVYLGTRVYELTKERMAHIRHHLPGLVETEGKLSYTHINDVPVEIKIIHRDYSFIKNPDQVLYLNEPYKIPNNWETYWKQKYLIR